MRRCVPFFAATIRLKPERRPPPIPQPLMKELEEKVLDGRQTIVLRDDPAEVVRVSATTRVSGSSLFTQASVTRKSPHVRKSREVFVVGGQEAIRRIWCEYGIRPNSVFVPDTDEVPAWCMNAELPSYVVRAPPVKINRSLLSAELNDGFAAEFPCPVMPPLTSLVECVPAGAEGQSGSTPNRPALQIRSTLVLHKVAMVSNVGMMLRAANSLGYDAVVLDRCTDVFNEKVLRASGGTAVDPKGPKLFQLTQRDITDRQLDPATLLQTAASVHNMLPLFALPSQEAEHVFPVAHRFHHNNDRRTAAGLPAISPMLVLGSERGGAAELAAAWSEHAPFKAVSLQMNNATIESLNVAVAASVLMHHFRPAAATEFRDLIARGVLPPSTGAAEEAPPLDAQQLAE